MNALLRGTCVGLAAALALSLAPMASGDTGSTAPVGHARLRPAPHKRPAKTKRKKTTRHPSTTATPRTAARLTLAASTDLNAPADGLVDESLLPSPRRGMCPPEMASIESRFCIDRWEGSLVESTSGGERPFSPFLVVDGRSVRAVSVPGVFPQGYVSGAQASDACARAGKRLCSATEWRKACVGPSARVYGYSDQRERGRCNDAGRSPMLNIWGATSLSGPGDWDPIKMNDERLNQLPGSLARTGAHADCTNEYGVFDMVGNLHEWTSDPDGTFQGGYYLDTTLNGEGCSYRTTAHDFGYHDYSTGFRCCSDPSGG